MNEKEVELVMGVIKGEFKVPPQYEARLRARFLDLNLRPVVRDSPNWVDGAREVARQIIKEAGEVTIVEVLDEYPLPPDVSNRMAGGVFRHKMFQRVGNRTIQDTNRRWRTIGVFALR